MEARRLPLVTVRCHVCGEQQTFQSTYFKRVDGKPDSVRPMPMCSGPAGAPHRANRIDASEIVQVNY